MKVHNLGVALLAIAGIVRPVLAETSLSPESSIPIVQPPASTTSLSVVQHIVNVANSLLPIFTLVAGVLAVFSLVFAGLKYITASGNHNQAKEARASVIHTVTGIVVIVATFELIRLAVSLGSSITR